MADRITVDMECYEDVARQLRRVEQELQDAGSRLRSLRLDRASGARVRMKNCIDALHTVSTPLGGTDVESNLQQIARATNSLASFTSALSGKARSAADVFTEAEERNISNAELGETGSFEGAAGSAAGAVAIGGMDWLHIAVGSEMGFPKDPTLWTDEMRAEVDKFLSNATVIGGDGMSIIMGEGKTMLMLGDDLLATYEHDESFSSISQKLMVPLGLGMVTLEKGAELTGPKWKKNFLDMVPDDKKTTSYYKDGVKYDEAPGRTVKEDFRLFSLNKSVGGEWAALNEHQKQIDGKRTIEGTVKAGTIGGEARAEAGIWRYTVSEDQTSKKVFAPGARVHVGVSTSLIEEKADISYEIIDNVSAGVGTEVKVLNGYVDGDVKLGIVDDGFSASASGKLGIDVMSANIHGSLDVAGLKGTAGVTAKVGVGVEGSIGYDDGVFKISGGAALGVGLSVNCELDVGGFVDNVVDTVGKSVDTIQSFAGDVMQGASSMMEDAASAFSNMFSFWG